MEYLEATLLYTRRSMSLVRHYDLVARVGTGLNYQNTLDVVKAHDQVTAECYLILIGEHDLGEIKTALFEEIHAWTEFRNHAITYLNRYRIVAQSYAYCKDVLDEGSWKGASTWYADYERCEKVLTDSEAYLLKPKSTVKSLLKKDSFGRKRNDCCESDTEAE
jgi:hypothetical protein